MVIGVAGNQYINAVGLCYPYIVAPDVIALCQCCVAFLTISFLLLSTLKYIRDVAKQAHEMWPTHHTPTTRFTVRFTLMIILSSGPKILVNVVYLVEDYPTPHQSVDQFPEAAYLIVIMTCLNALVAFSGNGPLQAWIRNFVAKILHKENKTSGATANQYATSHELARSKGEIVGDQDSL
jgi:hypothetical protein